MQPSSEHPVSISGESPVSSQDGISAWKVARELLATGLVSVLAFFAIHSSIENFRIDGPSMRPTLIDEQYLLANKIIYSRFAFHPPRRGDITIMAHPKDPSRHIVKRVVGLPGDIIAIDDGQVPPGAYYVLGDNRRMSTEECPQIRALGASSPPSISSDGHGSATGPPTGSSSSSRCGNQLGW